MELTQHTVVVMVIIAMTAGSVSSSINSDFYGVGPEATPPSPPPTVSTAPCRRTKSTANGANNAHTGRLPGDKYKLMGSGTLGSRTYEKIPQDNCTEEDSDGTSVQPVVYDHWKLHIIMACTVTAAIEFVLIIFIILYWRQIRWTLRKITCPRVCCQSSSHEAMDRDGAGTDVEVDDLDFGTIRLELGDSGHAPTGSVRSVAAELSDGRVHVYSAPCEGRVQVYSAPRASRVLSAADEPEAGPSGLSYGPHTHEQRRYSTSSSGSSTEPAPRQPSPRQPSPRQPAHLSPSSKCPPGGRIKGRKGRAQQASPSVNHQPACDNTLNRNCSSPTDTGINTQSGGVNSSNHGNVNDTDTQSTSNHGNVNVTDTQPTSNHGNMNLIDKHPFCADSVSVNNSDNKATNTEGICDKHESPKQYHNDP